MHCKILTRAKKKSLHPILYIASKVLVNLTVQGSVIDDISTDVEYPRERLGKIGFEQFLPLAAHSILRHLEVTCNINKVLKY